MRAMENYCSVLWSGPGWDNWDNTKSLDENVKRLYAAHPPAMIFCYHPFAIKGFASTDIPTCVSYNEMGTVEHPRSYTVKEITENRIDLVICHHKNEMLYPEFKNLPCKMVNIPHCAETSIFKDYGQEKSIDVLLVGQLHAQRYPLRTQLSKMILKMRQDPRFYRYNVGIFPHPGVRVSDAFTDREAVRFAKSINSAKICMTCSGVYRCRYAKYAEIPACRSLLMADLPDEDHPFFEQFMAVIDSNEAYDSVTEKVLRYLQDDAERSRLTDVGYALTRENFTQQHYAERFLTVVKGYLKEHKGKKCHNVLH